MVDGWWLLLSGCRWFMIFVRCFVMIDGWSIVDDRGPMIAEEEAEHEDKGFLPY